MASLKWRLARLAARMARGGDSPEYVARGWAIGMFYGCTIPFGFQLILSIPTAMLLKGSRVGATVGTFVTNHFTIFVIYPVQCWMGAKVLGLFGCRTMGAGEMVAELNRVGSLSMLGGEFWSALGSLGGAVTGAFFIGGAILAAVLTPLAYFGVLKFVRRRRAAKAGRKNGSGESAVRQA